MNLLDRLWKITPIIVIGILYGCEDPNDLGELLNSGDSKIEVLYKEILLEANNVFIDSVRTDNSTSLFVGKYNDPKFGETTSITYTQLDTRNAVFNGRDSPLNDYIIDSAFLQLTINYYHSDDSTQTHGFKLYTLADTLFNNVFYLSNNSTPRNDEVVGEVNDYVYDSEKNQIQINLTSEFVLQVLGQLENNASTVINSNRFQLELKGLAIESLTSNSGMFGFDSFSENSKLGIYYRVNNETEEDTVSTKFEFFLSNSSAYNKISSNRAGTTLNINTTDEKVIKTIDTGDDNLYLQPMTGIHPRIDLQPYLDFLNSVDNLILNRVDIELSITDDNSSFKYLERPEDLRYFFYDDGRNINVNGLLTNAFVNTLIMTNTSYLSRATEPLRAVINADDVYSADATLFSQFIASGNIDTRQLILIPSNITSMNRVVFDAKAVKMKIFYTVPK